MRAVLFLLREVAEVPAFFEGLDVLLRFPVPELRYAGGEFHDGFSGIGGQGFGRLGLKGGARQDEDAQNDHLDKPAHHKQCSFPLVDIFSKANRTHSFRLARSFSKSPASR